MVVSHRCQPALYVSRRPQDTALTSPQKDCVSSNLITPNCDPFASSDASCICRDTSKLDEAKLCIASACSSRDKLRAYELAAITCNDPIRNKATTYRIVNIVFYTLAVLSIFLRWTAHSTVGRMNWLDETNMFIILVSGPQFVQDVRLTFARCWTLYCLPYV
jgi:hypothetical protein